MTKTPNHGYNVPSEGEEDWHVPLNENFEAYDTDIELRDKAANIDDYEPDAGSKFLATDTGVIYVGDGSDWIPTLQAGRFSAPSDSSNAGGVAFGDPANDAGGDGATVAGGQANEAAHDHCTVGGGLDNRAARDSATVGGGQGNQAVDEGATVGGGIDNRASGDGATVAGGRENIASGKYSFAAGQKAEARRTGSFVWNNSGNRFLDTAEGQFLVNATGGVGIGTQSPDAPLHVLGSNDPARTGDLLVGTSTDHLSVSVATEGSRAGTTSLRAVGEDSDSHRLTLYSGDATVSLQDNGTVGIDTRDPHEDAQLHVANYDDSGFQANLLLEDGDDNGFSLSPFKNLSTGNANLAFYAWDSVSSSDREMVANIERDGSYNAFSDARLKRAIQPLDSVLDSICALRPSTFQWKRDDGDGENGDRSLGLIAQEVQDLFPEVVTSMDEDGYLGLDYSKFGVLAVQAVKEQQALIEEQGDELDEQAERVEQLEAAHDRKDERVEALEAQNDELEDRLAALEAQVGADTSAAPADD